MKKGIAASACILMILCLFLACQKELTGDVPGNTVITILPVGDAIYSLQQSNGSCSNISVAGTYTAGINLDSTAIIKVQLNVEKVGKYTIETPLVKGVKFAAADTFKSTGIITVTLKGTGTPTATGTIVIPVIAGISNCNFTINVSSPQAAVYSLVGTPVACLSPNVQGNYFQGFQLNATHKVELGVNVTTPGTYVVTTAPVSGISFNASGIFAAKGFQKLILQGSGVPVTAGQYNIPVIAGTSACSFGIDVISDSTSGNCSVANNTAKLSGVADMILNNITDTAAAGVYKITATATNGDLKFKFFGSTQPTAGAYTIKPSSANLATCEVSVNMTAANIYWSAAAGKVTVTVANGKVTATFCNVDFTGILNGQNYQVKGQGKVTEQ